VIPGGPGGVKINHGGVVLTVELMIIYIARYSKNDEIARFLYEYVSTHASAQEDLSGFPQQLHQSMEKARVLRASR
jgi:hypothetical protein